mmetsp:Transcript_7787/g.23067  ORF Transcript_7787/g.23067 Transcript_7787/m.23067 type:complete len:217 (-) Transcript_7787:55-705(-)
MGSVGPNPTQELASELVAGTRHPQPVADGIAQLGLEHAQGEFGFLTLLHLGEVLLQEGFQRVRHAALAHSGRLLQSLSGCEEALECHKRHRLAETRQVCRQSSRGIPALGQLICLLHLEERIAVRCLKQQVCRHGARLPGASCTPLQGQAAKTVLRPSRLLCKQHTTASAAMLPSSPLLRVTVALPNSHKRMQAADSQQIRTLDDHNDPIDTTTDR